VLRLIALIFSLTHQLVDLRSSVLAEEMSGDAEGVKQPGAVLFLEGLSKRPSDTHQTAKRGGTTSSLKLFATCVSGVLGVDGL